MIYNVQAHLNPRWRLVIDRDAHAAFWKQFHTQGWNGFSLIAMI